MDPRASFSLLEESSRMAVAPTGDLDAPHVYLTLYDLSAACNMCCAHWLGIGVYHSGILLQGVEYTFDNIASFNGSGVIRHEPYYDDLERRATLPLRCKILLGRSRLSARDSHDQLVRMAPQWPAESYDVLEHNCHHWSVEAAGALGVQPPPPWVMRSTELLRFFSGVDSRVIAKAEAPRLSMCRLGHSSSDSQRKSAARRGCGGCAKADKRSPRESDGRLEAFGDDDEGCEPLIRSESSASLCEHDKT